MKFWLNFARFSLFPAMLFSGALSAAVPTWSGEVASLIYKNCTTCHRPGEAAPFSFTRYAEVRKRSELIREVVTDRYMPPWHAEAGDVAFADERRLSHAHIKLLTDWIDAGMPEGDSARAPKLPEFPSGWQLGEPDLVVKMSEAFEVPASGADIYRNFVIPLNLTEDKWVKALEFRPGAPSVVHHSLFYYDTSGEARRLDAADARPGFARMGSFRRQELGGWAVGGQPKNLPGDLAWKLPAGADLILSTHFHPSGKKENELSIVGLYFSDIPPNRSFAGIQLPPAFGALAGINIPPGEKRYVKRQAFTLNEDVLAFGVSAHAHYLGRELRMSATLPDGSIQRLLEIGDWDFNWQEMYMFRDFHKLPRGTRLEAEVIWDNSAGNIHNPHDPPQRVFWGRESTDEMGSVTLMVTAESEKAMQNLRAAYLTSVRHHSRQRRQQGEVQKNWSDRLAEARKRFDRDGDGELNAAERKAALEALKKIPATEPLISA